MKIVAISDTHRKHDKVILPHGDMLIFAGDGDWRSPASTNPFLDWFESQSHKHKIMIAGNHDFVFEHSTKEHYNDYMRHIASRNIIYLENSGTEIEGLKIWGSPASPVFGPWAFMYSRGSKINKYWKMIPEDTDILITHSPPMYIMDKCKGIPVGCKDLAERVKIIKPKVHIFGHIHSQQGILEKEGTIYVNASVLDEAYNFKYKPKVIDL